MTRLQAAAIDPFALTPPELEALAALGLGASTHLDAMRESSAYRTWHHMRNAREIGERLGTGLDAMGEKIDERDVDRFDRHDAHRALKHLVFALQSLVEWLTDAPAVITKARVEDRDEQVNGYTGPTPSAAQLAKRKLRKPKVNPKAFVEDVLGPAGPAEARHEAIEAALDDQSAEVMAEHEEQLRRAEANCAPRVSLEATHVERAGHHMACAACFDDGTMGKGDALEVVIAKGGAHFMRALVGFLEWVAEEHAAQAGTGVAAPNHEGAACTDVAAEIARLDTEIAEGLARFDEPDAVEAQPVETLVDHNGLNLPAREFHLAQMDCVAFLKTLGDETVDLIVMDPAYESLEKHRAIGTTTRLTADWFEIFRNERFLELLAECMRVLNKDAHLYIYSDQETAFVTKPMAEAAGFKWWKHLTWEKTTTKVRPGEEEPSAFGGMGYHYRNATEWIGFYEKGKRKLADLGITDVLRAPRVKGYPTEKPVSVSRTLIEQSCPVGGLVVDCFMGSGSTGDAAFLAGCRFAGCDVAPRSIELARGRLLALGGVEVGPPPGPVPLAQGRLF